MRPRSQDSVERILLRVKIELRPVCVEMHDCMSLLKRHFTRIEPFFGIFIRQN